MRSLVVLIVFFGTAVAGVLTNNIYLFLAAPVAATVLSVVLRATGWPRKRP